MLLDAFVRWVERTAGLFLLAVALLTFAMVILRKFFDLSIPDWYDFSRLLQGIAIVWGIACACYRGSHIVVDLVWDFCGPRNRHRIDRFATGTLLLFMVAFAAMALQAAFEMRGNHLLTNDLRIPQWGFYMTGALGALLAAAMTAIRLRRLRAGSADDPSDVAAEAGASAGARVDANDARGR